MRIGIFTDSFRPIVNGASFSVQSFARQLIERGHDIHVFAPHYPDYDDPGDYPVHRYPGILTSFEQGYNMAVPMWPMMSQIMRRASLEIIHTQSPFLLGIAGARWSRWMRLPLVTTHHTLYTEYVHYVSHVPPALSKLGVVAWTRHYCNRANQVLVPTEPIREVLRGYGVERPISIVATGIDREAIRSASPDGIRELHGIPEDAELVAFAGRLAKEKNVETLIDAFKRVARMRPRAYLMLIGGGQEEECLRERAARYGLTDRVVFAGWQTPDERNRRLQAADLFLYPSVTDTQGLVLCEALAAGLPCIAADAYGSKAVIRHEVDGYLVPSTPEALGKATIKLLSQPRLRQKMSEEASQGAERFTEAHATDRLLEAYEKALEEGPLPGFRRRMNRHLKPSRTEVLASFHDKTR